MAKCKDVVDILRVRVLPKEKKQHSITDRLKFNEFRNIDVPVSVHHEVLEATRLSTLVSLFRNP